MPLRQLFGGAIEADVPVAYEDISMFRVIPDNQEVFACADTDRSLIVDILEYTEIPDDQAPHLLFSHIADSNESNNPEDTQVHAVEPVVLASHAPSLHLNLGATVYTLSGTQKVSKFHEGPNAKNVVRIYMAVVRLPKFQTDIVISHNVPIKFDAQSSSAAKCRILESDSTAPGLGEFLTLLRSFNVKDVNLFG